MPPCLHDARVVPQTSSLQRGFGPLLGFLSLAPLCRGLRLGLFPRPGPPDEARVAGALLGLWRALRPAPLDVGLALSYLGAEAGALLLPVEPALFDFNVIHNGHHVTEEMKAAPLGSLRAQFTRSTNLMPIESV
jgi:hypothetical protein